MDFAAQMKQAVAEMTAGLVDRGVKPVVNNVAYYAVVETPVDTGNARFNWVGSLNAPVYETMEYMDSDNELGSFTAGVMSPAAELALREIGQVVDEITGDTNAFYLTNSVDYIKALEAGKSKQSMNFAAQSVEYAARLAVADAQMRSM